MPTDIELHVARHRAWKAVKQLELKTARIMQSVTDDMQPFMNTSGDTGLVADALAAQRAIDTWIATAQRTEAK